MSLIREVKERANIVKVAELYGLKLNRAYKCVCPFHKEKTASLSISPQKQIWKCFGCGKGGDVISIVSELLNINALEAAKSINYTLGLGLDPNQKSSYFQINKYKTKKKAEENFKQWENNTFQLLCDYLHSLNKVEYLQEGNIIEYFIDEIFINGSNGDKIWFWKNERAFVEKIKNARR